MATTIYHYFHSNGKYFVMEGKVSSLLDKLAGNMETVVDIAIKS